MTACLIYLSTSDLAWLRDKNTFHFRQAEDLHIGYTEMLSTLLPPPQFHLTRLDPTLILAITIPHGFQCKSDLIVRCSLQARCKIQICCR